MAAIQASTKRNFGLLLKREREARGVSMNKLAEEMMEKHGAGKGAVSNISRMEKGDERPSEARVYQIVDALTDIAGDSALEKDRLLKNLMAAADVGGISDTDQIEYLKRKSEKKLRENSPLKTHEIQTILSHISIPTLKRLAEADDNDERIAELLNEIARELGDVASSSRAPLSPEDRDNMFANAEHVIERGRVTILIKGEIEPDQETVLKHLANGMMYLLK